MRSVTSPPSDEPTVLIINGPNLNMLGVREPSVYGPDTLGDIEAACAERALLLGVSVDFRQSNSESEIISWIQEARGNDDGIIINAAGLSHTSVAILDALRMAELPIIEVHLSNIYQRESYRHHSYVSEAATGIICGLGGQGYMFALDAMAGLIGANS